MCLRLRAWVEQEWVRLWEAGPPRRSATGAGPRKGGKGEAGAVDQGPEDPKQAWAKN